MPIQPWSERIWVVRLADEPALSEDLIAAHDQAARVDPMPQLVIDFSAVRQVNSSNLSQLLKLRKATIDRGSRLKLAAMTDSAWVAFLTTGLDKVFEFAEDVPSALASIQIDSP